MSFLLALSFLTYIPVSLGRIMSDEEMGHSTRWFPAVGAVIGCLLALAFVLLNGVTSPSVKAAIVLIVWMALTRGLHLDGLADTFDGLGGGASRERALEIMKDSRIGTFGALAIGAVLILKFATMSSLRGEDFRWVLVSPVLARWGIVLAIFFFPPARRDGAGRIFIKSCRWLELSIASCFTLAVSIALMGWIGLAITGLSGLISLTLGSLISGRLKGLTGDSYGCICEITEVLVLLVGSVIAFWQDIIEIGVLDVPSDAAIGEQKERLKMSFKVKIKGFSSIQCDMPLSGQGILASTGLYRNKNIVAWRVNNYLRPLEWVLDGESSVEFVDTNSFEGTMVYRSSLGFLLLLAARKALGKPIFIRHSISEGHFWEFVDGEVTEKDLESIKETMRDLIDMDIPIAREVVSLDKACRIFQRQGNPEKGRLFSRVAMDPIEVYRCLDMYGFFYCPLVPSTGYLKNWDLRLLSPGMVLQFPTVAYPTSLPPFQASKKLSAVFLEYANWLKTMGVSSMVNLHDAIADGRGQELMLISEAFHSQRLSNLADDVVNRNAALVCIAGPSASGKTTISKRLKIQLQVCGKRPVTLSLDDYFVDRERTPLDEKGEYDFEALEALDLELLNEHLKLLLSGQEVQLPLFDFVTGSRKEGRILKLDSDDILIIEGIHGLNDRVTQEVPQDKKFRIFVSPLTGVSLDRQNRTSTTDNRLFRRMIRDHRTRGHSPEATLKRWPSVIRGAQKYIFPYQKHSDVMFNSALLYELPVLKGYLEPLLQTVPEDSAVFGESRRLLSLLRFVPPFPSDKVPNESILREFIGGSLFED